MVTLYLRDILRDFDQSIDPHPQTPLPVTSLDAPRDPLDQHIVRVVSVLRLDRSISEELRAEFDSFISLFNENRLLSLAEKNTFHPALKD